MKETTHSLPHFDLPRFIHTIMAFWGGDHEVAFPLVHDGFADFGTFCLDDGAGNVGDTPLEWLQHGLLLFAQFTRGDGTSYDLADGTQIEVSDDDESDDVYLDDSSTYGFLLRLNGDKLTIQTAVLRDVTGECKVEVAEGVGPFEKPMARLLKSMKGHHDRHP